VDVSLGHSAVRKRAASFCANGVVPPRRMEVLIEIISLRMSRASRWGLGRRFLGGRAATTVRDNARASAGRIRNSGING